MANENAEVKKHIQLGIRDFLTGWNEMAQLHFRQAVTFDSGAALGWCGLMLTEGVTDESREALSKLLNDECPTTPQELALLSTWLCLIQSGPEGGAGEEFAQRASSYRQDILSACWAIYLLHDRYEEVGGKPYPRQQKALELALELYQRQPQNPLVSYLRGWVEESAPQPSEEALSAAQSAAEAMPEHPSAQLLYGHLLYRRGRFNDASIYLHRASELAENCRKNVPCGTSGHEQISSYPLEKWPLEVRAKLYESTLLWLQGMKRESLLLQSELLKNAKTCPPELAHTPGAILLQWEARTLALRLLMLSPDIPSQAQISAAVNAATPAPSELSGTLLEVRDCLRFCLVARQRAAAGKREQALRCIQSAEACYQRLKGEQGSIVGQGDYVCSSWNRACEACHLALLGAKAAAYPDTADIWLHSLELATRPSSMLMPPVLPYLKK